MPWPGTASAAWAREWTAIWSSRSGRQRCSMRASDPAPTRSSAPAVWQLAASLQWVDPQQQHEQARATCELLEQAVSSFRERLVGLVEAPDGGARMPRERSRTLIEPVSGAGGLAPDR